MTVSTEPSRVGVPGRLAVQAERRLERRRRLVLAVLGIALLVALLATTVIVVDVIR